MKATTTMYTSNSHVPPVYMAADSLGEFYKSDIVLISCKVSNEYLEDVKVIKQQQRRAWA